MLHTHIGFAIVCWKPNVYRFKTGKGRIVKIS